MENAIAYKDSKPNCAFRLGLDDKYFRSLASRARVHGIEAVLHSNTLRAYTDELKLAVVDSVVLEGVSKQGASTKYNIPSCVIYTWVNKYIEGDEEALLSDDRGRKGKMGRKPKPKLEDFEVGTPEYYKLKSERLERENLLLKKALPLVRDAIRNRSKGKSDAGSSEN
ncbi:MAG: hypothetical protein SPD11_08705 [Sphaerochaetaceae bacterium]|nr:hypothetical protein [Sphaerochaetaceae bacterium]